MDPLSWRRAGAPARTRAVFVDRDGVLNRWIRGGYVLRCEDIVFNDESIRALAGIDRERFALVVISNQSCVGRGLLDAESLRSIMAYVVQGATARGLDIDAWYCCIHAPDAGCACRKPAPGLLSQAGADFGFDPARSYFIGDQASDMEAAARAGVVGLPVRPDDAAGVRAQLARIATETQHVG
jgi:D-glycero-D-manno-heptose 1,7-bisphosphate phosphatase